MNSKTLTDLFDYKLKFSFMFDFPNGPWEVFFLRFNLGIN